MDYFYTKELAAGYGKEPVVKGANLHLQKGEIVTLIAPNGAGKTTLLKSITRQLEPLGGVAVLEGRNLAEYHGKELASRLSVVLTERIRPERDDLPGSHRHRALSLYGYAGGAVPGG